MDNFRMRNMQNG